MEFSGFEDVRQYVVDNEVDSLSTAEQRAFVDSVNNLEKLASKKVYILSDFTVDTIKNDIRLAFCSVALKTKVSFAPYGQYMQMALDPNSELFEFKPDLVILLLSYSDVLGNRDMGLETKKKIADLTLWAESIREKLTSHVLLGNAILPSFPRLGIADHGQLNNEFSCVCQINTRLSKLAQKTLGVSILDVNKLAMRIGSNSVFDPKFQYIAKMVWSQKFLKVISFEVATIANAIFGRVIKCVVLDLDNTLWSGIVGEDGVSGIRIGNGTAAGEAYRDFQFSLSSLIKRGIVLAVCSKNNEADAKRPFIERSSDMVLRLDDFVAFYANWDSKVENLRRIASDLNISLSDIAFIDDNPLEVGQMKALLPEVLTIQTPEACEKLPSLVNRIAFFEKLKVIPEDRLKTQTYQQNASRSFLRSSKNSLDEFLESLKMKVVVSRLRPENVDRASQLVSKTNQFNLTTKRYTVRELEEFIGNKNKDVICINVVDRFGDMGMVGLAIVFHEEHIPVIDSFILSCRAMGRRVESVMLNYLIQEYLVKPGKAHIKGLYRKTEKNKPAEGFYMDHGFIPCPDKGGFMLAADEFTVSELKYIDVEEV